MLHTKLTSITIATFLMTLILALSTVYADHCKGGHAGRPECPPPGPTIEQIAQRVSNLETALGSLETRLGLLETTVGTLQSTVSDLKTNVANLQNDVAILQEHVSQDLEVVDVSNEVVGKIISVPGSLDFVTVAFKIDIHIFVLRLLKDKFKGTVDRIGGNQGVAFKTPDCTKTPFVAFLNEANNSLLPITQVAGPGNTVYIPQPGAASQVPTLSSIRRENGDCDPISLTSTRVFPAEVIINMNTFYQPPFAIR